MVKVDPTWRPVAFKEWKVVCDAIASGEQSLLLRKGGISEGKHGFQWLHSSFFLFPSLFHEQGGLVRPLPGGRPRGFEPGEPGSDIEFSLFVETVSHGRLTDWDEICELEPYHIWSRDCIRERFEWGDEPGISFAAIRAARLASPWILPDRKGFGGCRSWIGLPAEENGGFRERLDGAEWVEPQLPLSNLTSAK